MGHAQSLTRCRASRTSWWPAPTSPWPGRIPLLEVIAERRRYIDIEMAYTESLKQVYDAVVEVGMTERRMRPP